MAELLELTTAEVEECLSSLVVSKTVRAKVDRPAGIVQFFAGPPEPLTQSSEKPAGAGEGAAAKTALTETGSSLVNDLGGEVGGGPQNGASAAGAGPAESGEGGGAADDEGPVVVKRKPAPHEPVAVLNEWASTVREVMLLINKATHLINKEEVVHHVTLTETDRAHPPVDENAH